MLLVVNSYEIQNLCHQLIMRDRETNSFTRKKKGLLILIQQGKMKIIMSIIQVETKANSLHQVMKYT